MADVKISGLPASTAPLTGSEVLPIVQGGVTKQVSVDNLTAGKAVSATQYTSTVATGTAPLVVSSTTEVANLRAANATSADTANQVKSNATTGVLQVTGPTAASTRVMTTPDANFTVARTDAANSFTADQTLATGNLVIGTSGKGIDFSATPGTGTSELFNDYEEGTWTPEYNTTNNDIANVGYYRRYGVYTKVGNLVTVTFAIATNNAASISGTGSVTLTGLPFGINIPTTASFFAAAISSGRFTSNDPIFVNTGTNGATSLAFGTKIGVAELTIADFNATNTNNYNITSGSFTYRVS